MVDKGSVMRAGLRDEGMRIESEMVDEGAVMEAGLTDEGM